MTAEVRRGRVVETRGRRVLVESDGEEVVCFLQGKRAVVGDEVRWSEITGSGGKLLSVLKRRTALSRSDPRGKEQVLAANLQGLLIVCSPINPPFRAGLIDRYCVAAGAAGLEAVVVINKSDLEIPDAVGEEMGLREGIRCLYTSAQASTGLDELRSVLADAEGPWALVGHSGVGKTSLIKALLPDEDVGAVGELSDYWDRGQHTTTRSKLFTLPTGGEVVDSPGIRTFAPGGLKPVDIRRHFPGMPELGCRYRNCLHRDGEDGCVADTLPERLLESYRRLLGELLSIEDKKRPR